MRSSWIIWVDPKSSDKFQETHSERRWWSCEDRGRNWSNAATNLEMPNAPRSWMRQGTHSAIELPEGTDPTNTWFQTSGLQNFNPFKLGFVLRPRNSMIYHDEYSVCAWEKRSILLLLSGVFCISLVKLFSSSIASLIWFTCSISCWERSVEIINYRCRLFYFSF